jgi:chaperonin GroES
MYDRVLVRKIKPETVRSSGLILAVDLASTTEQGVVVQLGNGKTTSNGTLIPLDVVVGDTVMFMSGTGTSVVLNEEKLTLLNESDIIAVVSET